MCSTLHVLFNGKRELFRDLYIDKTDYYFEKYSVMHFNIALLSNVSYKAASDKTALNHLMKFTCG